MTGRSVHTAGFADLDPTTAYVLWKLRVDVFVVEQACPYPELDGRDTEPGTRHLWVDSEHVPIGYLRILDDTDVARIGRVCVSAPHRGEGVAATLVEAALAEIGGRVAVLDAQAQLVGWYERFDFVVSGPAFVEDGIPHVPMRRDLRSPHLPA